MASIRKVGKRYRAELYRLGKRESATFATKQEASAWALQRDAELSGRALPFKTLADALTKYANGVSPEHKGERWEQLRISALLKYPVARKPLAKLTADDLIEWRDNRLKLVSKATVLREMNLLGSVIETARKEWRWIRENPMKDVTRPKQPPSRKRRVSQNEIDALIQASGYVDGTTPRTMAEMTVCAFLFAIETAMRSGEILGLTWDRVEEKVVTLEQTKNGDKREVPLSPKARTIISALRGFDKPFPISSGSRDAIFRKLRDTAGLSNLHFHDSRSQAIYQLSKKLSILDLARVIGHRDLKSLMIYYNESAESMADRL